MAKILSFLICFLLCVAGVAQEATNTSGSRVPTVQPTVTRVDPVSLQSLLLALFSRGQFLGTGTGFVVQKNDKAYLVTNWHVVSARRPDTGAAMDPMERYPDEIRILQNQKGHLGSWIYKSEKLVNEKNEALWIEHPAGRGVDVVFLPLTNLSDVQLYPVNLELRKTQITILPTSPLSIVGFPFGQSESGGLPIWKTGTVASDPDIDYDKTPQILVDCTGRPGMSGSPVYARRIGPYSEGAGLVFSSNATTDRFIGIYAGSIDDRSEIGRVWKASAIMTIYDALP
jgi:Trypsin-like peptidase domain